MAAEQGMLLNYYSVYDSSITCNNTEVQRRPYHRNCGCALHRTRGACHHSSSSSKSVSYPMRRSWSEGSLALSYNNTINSPYSSSSPSSSSSNTSS